VPRLGIEALGAVQRLWDQALAIWISGGWCMPAIAVVGFAMFAIATHVQLELLAKGFLSVPERIWRRWIDRPQERTGSIGSLLDFATGGKTLEDCAVFFRELRIAEIAPFERDLRLMRICIGAAPLLGLLGTVTGMLATFEALAGGSGGEETMGLVAKGISEALITTETGLVIALPGLLLQYHLARQFERYEAFLAHLETVCTQHLYKALRKQELAPRADAERQLCTAAP
jgi:biopolymer transport protein ExbB